VVSFCSVFLVDFPGKANVENFFGKVVSFSEAPSFFKVAVFCPSPGKVPFFFKVPSLCSAWSVD